MSPVQFVSQLSALRFEDAFNPYSEKCPVHDIDNAPAQRSALLADILQSALQVEVDALWIGRDLGFRGGRRTGMALTDDVHFHDHLARWGLSRAKPTVGQPVAERTAKFIWAMLEEIPAPIFLWNVFPLHPHVPGAPFTNRAHNARERKAGTEILDELIRLLRPKRLVAVGNDAEKVLNGIAGRREVSKVRHPSYGGQAEFTSQIQSLYGLRMATLL